MKSDVKYLLDTCICVFALRDKYGIVDMLDKIDNSCCFISEVTLAELKYGVECSKDKSKNMKELLAFVEELNVVPFEVSIDVFSKEKARLRREGLNIDDFDLLIGSAAIALGMTLVTDNVKRFNRIDGLVVENWVER